MSVGCVQRMNGASIHDPQPSYPSFSHLEEDPLVCFPTFLFTGAGNSMPISAI